MNIAQEANATTGSLIIQSQGDTIIGSSVDDIKAIVEILADQMPKFAAVATAIVEARMKTFEDKILASFATASPEVTEAFKDPDFQYVVRIAQHAYARSGEEYTADTLIDLIAERAKHPKRTRLSLSLNDAVERSPLLTENELAELAMIFALRYTRIAVSNFEALVDYLKTLSLAFVKDISKSTSSYDYLAAHSCADVSLLTGMGLFDVLKANYGGLITKGAPRESFAAVIGEEMSLNTHLVIKSLHDPNNVQANAVAKEIYAERLATFGLADKTEQLWNLQVQGFLSQDELIEKATGIYPDVQTLFQAWDGTPMKSTTLTSVGLTIGFANLKRVCGFDADLAIWIP